MPRSQTPLFGIPLSTWSIAAAGLLASQLLVLALQFGAPDGFILVETGKLRNVEFAGVRAAGELVLEGRAADAYDWAAHGARLRAIAETQSANSYPWGYPPPYLFVAAALAVATPVVTALAWLGLTLAGYLVVVQAVARNRHAALWAAAAPATFVNTMVLHTGFWTSGVLGGGLLLLERRPVLAGVCLGTLVMKPQLALLLPFALAAGGYWRSFAATGAMAFGLAVLSLLAFGTEPWFAFVPQAARIAETVREGHVNYHMLVTVYGAVRAIGCSDAMAMSLQAVVSMALVAGIVRLWRSSASLALKSAGLTSASLLATPYMFAYDVTMLAVVAAFLARDAGSTRLPQALVALLCASAAAIFLLPVPAPIGFLAVALTAAVVAVRVWPYVRPHRSTAGIAAEA